MAVTVSGAQLVAPSQARGLKQASIAKRPGLERRAFTGAWIETTEYDIAWNPSGVAPSQARGLKLRFVVGLCLPSCGRAFTGAWIETALGLSQWLTGTGRAFTGAWIETRPPSCCRPPQGRRAFTGAWIETTDIPVTLDTA